MRIALVMSAVLALPAAESRIIPNPLGQSWPWELVSMDFESKVIQPGWVAAIEGVPEPRPILIEQVQIDGRSVDRVWFIATLSGSQPKATVTFAPGTATSALALRSEDGFTIVDTGVAELRLRLGSPVAGTPLSAVPHWLGGFASQARRPGMPAPPSPGRPRWPGSTSRPSPRGRYSRNGA
jgi:hypothetical protein